MGTTPTHYVQSHFLPVTTLGGGGPPSFFKDRDVWAYRRERHSPGDRVSRRQSRSADTVGAPNAGSVDGLHHGREGTRSSDPFTGARTAVMIVYNSGWQQRGPLEVCSLRGKACFASSRLPGGRRDGEKHGQSLLGASLTFPGEEASDLLNWQVSRRNRAAQWALFGRKGHVPTSSEVRSGPMARFGQQVISASHRC